MSFICDFTNCYRIVFLFGWMLLSGWSAYATCNVKFKIRFFFFESKRFALIWFLCLGLFCTYDSKDEKNFFTFSTFRESEERYKTKIGQMEERFYAEKRDLTKDLEQVPIIFCLCFWTFSYVFFFCFETSRKVSDEQ